MPDGGVSARGAKSLNSLTCCFTCDVIPTGKANFMKCGTFARLSEPAQKRFVEAMAPDDPAEKAAPICVAANMGVIEIQKITFEQDFSQGFAPGNNWGMTQASRHLLIDLIMVGFAV
jgi:hypothetical protein